MKKLKLYTPLTLTCLLLFSSCAANLKGPLFQPSAEASDAKALIYLYWPKEKLRTEFTIKANGETITTLKNGGYFPLVVEPGEIKLSANVNFKMFVTGALEAATAPSTHLTLNAAPGDVFYVRCSGLPPKFPSLSITYGQRLDMTPVASHSGDTEIRNCKLLAAR